MSKASKNSKRVYFHLVCPDCKLRWYLITVNKQRKDKDKTFHKFCKSCRGHKVMTLKEHKRGK